MKFYQIALHLMLMLSTSVAMGQWKEIPSGTDQELFSVHFPSEKVGYIGGRGATILKTTDQGDTWNALSTGLSWEIFQTVFFLNDTIGFITGITNGKVLKTKNGGEVWSVHQLPTSNSLNEINFINDTTGLIVGYREIWKTTDQGETWVSQYANQNLAFPVFYSVEFVNQDTIFIAGVDGDLGRILKSTDGGKEWTSTSFSQWMRFDVKFVNDTVGYTVGSSSDIFKTVDGGVSWSLLADPGFENNRNLAFVNDTIAYIAGYDGRILSTQDGGLNWATEVTNTTKNLHSIDFIHENRGFAVGDSGTVLLYAKAVDIEGPAEEETEIITSIADKPLQQKQFLVFPNPAAGMLNIQLESQQLQEMHLSITNQLGEKVYAEKVLFAPEKLLKTIVLPKLSNGVYFLSLKSSKEVYNRKLFIKQ